MGAHFVRVLDTNGDDTGENNMIGNYGLTPEIVYMQAAPGKQYNLTRLVVNTEDNSGMRAEHYGTLGNALTNGIIVRYQDDSGTITDFTAGLPVKKNAHYDRMAGVDAEVKSWGAGDDLLAVRFTFEKLGGPLVISGDRRIEVVLNDDFTGMVEHYFIVHGKVHK